MARGDHLKKDIKLAPELSEFVGAESMSRPDVMKKIWEHIKANGLQNPTDKRIINCDEKLKKILGEDSLNMFKIASAINKFFVKE